MPTTDIIGYLWHKRHALGIETLTDVLDLTGDLVASGHEVMTVTDQTVLGIPVGAVTVLPRKTPEEWEPIVHDAIVKAAVADAEKAFQGQTLFDEDF